VGKSPQFVRQTKAVGQYSLHSRAILAYYKNNWYKFSHCLMFRKNIYVRKKFWTPKMVHCPKFFCSTKNFSGVVGQNPKKSGKFLSAPLIFSFPYAHVDNTSLQYKTRKVQLFCYYTMAHIHHSILSILKLSTWIGLPPIS
jgi:hypothetical protein